MTTVDPVRLVEAANPIPTEALDAADSAQMEALLERLHQGEIGVPATVVRGDRRGQRHLVAALIAAAVVCAGAAAALAADGRPFTHLAEFIGLGAADRPQTPGDALDPETAVEVEQWNAHIAAAHARGLPLSQHVLLAETARLVGQLPDAGNVYVLSASDGELCLVTARDGGICDAPLGKDKPTTFGTWDQIQSGPDATPPITWGVARDGVTSVSFTIDGHDVTVPVVNNVWVYEGETPFPGEAAVDVASGPVTVVVHYDDGTTETVTN